MNILVTGRAGYIGSHVVKQLLETTDHDVTPYSLLSSFQQTVDAFIVKAARAWEEKHHAALHQNTFDSEGKTL